jgi:DNA-binding PadR family transcriptional regulator
MPELRGDFLALCLLMFERHPNIWGADLHRRLCIDLERDVPIAQVFNAIERLHSKNWVKEKLIPTPKGEKGPPRAGYTLTQKGKDALAELFQNSGDLKKSPNSKAGTVKLLNKLMDERSA